jgi:hypothetical protein
LCGAGSFAALTTELLAASCNKNDEQPIGRRRPKRALSNEERALSSQPLRNSKTGQIRRRRATTTTSSTTSSSVRRRRPPSPSLITKNKSLFYCLPYIPSSYLINPKSTKDNTIPYR